MILLAAGDINFTLVNFRRGSIRWKRPFQPYAGLPQRLQLDPLSDVQIITPTHLGLLGTKAINQMMQRLLHGDVARRFAVGDKVIQTVNDYDLGVMNGTIGRVLDIDACPTGGYRGPGPGRAAFAYRTGGGRVCGTGRLHRVCLGTRWCGLGRSGPELRNPQGRCIGRLAWDRRCAGRG